MRHMSGFVKVKSQQLSTTGAKEGTQRNPSGMHQLLVLKDTLPQLHMSAFCPQYPVFLSERMTSGAMYVHVPATVAHTLFSLLLQKPKSVIFMRGQGLPAGELDRLSWVSCCRDCLDGGSRCVPSKLAALEIAAKHEASCCKGEKQKGVLGSTTSVFSSLISL